MAEILILGQTAPERQGLSLVMELAGHKCVDVETLEQAVDQLTKNPSYNLVLSDPNIGESNAEEIQRVLRVAAPQIQIIILAEDSLSAELNDDVDVITAATSPLKKLPTKYSPVPRDQALLVMLPEQESLRLLKEVPRTAGMLNKLAMLYHSQEKYQAAEKLYKQALRLSENDPREAASTLHNLANLYRDQKRYLDAEPLYLKSIALAEKVFGKNHPKVWSRLNNLAGIYRAQGREAELKPLLMRFT